ncbi:hypothetical protein SAMN04487970_102714 [Paenibacillus tianmuensis]|uniref:DUF3139 domain-containing protein n=1 Tax=Paenibacillus tianmuensis TaxID=624147 RepID=A0A1G4SER6_9BACL|nr:hypothetical protein [Paenibacillus tianmuensis]SCW67417.1 hypothetical protein SAMN04487970_102714 [Paenibacillus tianmuensis]
MVKFKRKKTIILSIIFIILVFHMTGTIQRVTARLTLSIYITMKYNEMELKYKKIEYSSQFGDYIVSYESKEGIVYNFMVTPKFMPVIISFDPIHPDV